MASNPVNELFFMLRSALLTLVISLVAMTGFAQTPTIKGVVTDKTDTKPLAGATVSLLLQQDSSLVSRKVTDASGLFEFSPSAADSFIVTVDLLNYQQYVSFFTLRDSSLTKEMGILGLERQGTDLSAVTVVSRVNGYPIARTH
ncbi:MAG: carboxypeptidase regulatory-like domain-containing protein [Chitinophagaceae bacterium]|nr:MAG: carboxypeptidase regulatory-like domain-containing protein [Chitinophagaceae bacterium]